MTPEEIRKLRAGYKQAEFAKALGVTRLTVIRWESGKHPPSGEHLERLKKFAGVKLDAEKEIADLKNQVRYWRRRFEKRWGWVDGSDSVGKEPTKIYRKIAAKYHPDKKGPVPSREEIMRDINELWQAKREAGR